VISSSTDPGSANALRAFSAGAIGVIGKPQMSSVEAMQDFCTELVERIKVVSIAKLALPAQVLREGKTAPVNDGLKISQQIIAFAASTGGTEALKQVLSELPRGMPGIVIVQHMPRFFTQAFASSLNHICRMHVKEAEDGDKIQPGVALLAPGDFHMEVIRKGGEHVVRLHQAPPLHGVRPAADFLLKSVAEHCGSAAIGLILTGMGKDGAAGLLAMREAGAKTIVQDEASSIVFGMPKAAIDQGAAQYVVSLNKIAPTLLQQLEQG
ncbi:MAG TPA: chemotaxis protein CheB, partial [Oligoflexus sp.]|uniref:chemotaxis protein CheB n=1 Tax=Oligoflexus sp. TaxID=1971216 RepID=UPI002D3F51F8